MISSDPGHHSYVGISTNLRSEEICVLAKFECMRGGWEWGMVAAHARLEEQFVAAQRDGPVRENIAPVFGGGWVYHGWE